MARLRRCLPGVLLLWLGGCSGVQLAYDNLDRLARWSLGDYVELDGAQQAYFDHRFAELWDWHRAEHLPRYAETLSALALRLDGGTVGEADLQALVDRVRRWGEEIQARALPVAAELLASLSDEQVRALAAALEERNRELAELEIDATLEEAQAAWAERYEDRFTRFSGRLTRAQRDYLEQRAKDYRPELVLWADYRRRWQRDFLALLAHRHHPAGLERGLAELAAERETYFGAPLRTVYEHNNALAREAGVWLLNSLSDRQRRRFVDRLVRLAGDLRALAADDRPRAPRAAAPCLVAC